MKAHEARIVQFSDRSDVTVYKASCGKRYCCMLCSISAKTTVELFPGAEAVRHFAAHREVGDLVPSRVFEVVSKKESAP